MAAGRCSRAPTECVIPLHPRATCLTDLRDHAVCLMKWRGRHCLGGGCDGQSKSNSDKPNHCFLRDYPFGERRRPAAMRGWPPQRVCRARREGKDRREQTTPSARRGDYRRAMWPIVMSLMGSPTKNWSKLLTADHSPSERTPGVSCKTMFNNELWTSKPEPPPV